MIPQITNDNNKTVCTITIGKHACKYIYCVTKAQSLQTNIM